tara:strand:- start:134 stop:448 length:315 start_codon:yes stop_codon:yes gene_type:complete
MARDTPTTEINIKFNNRVLDGYEISEYPRFNICVYYGAEEIGEYEETEYLEYFYPTEKDMLIDYINNELEQTLNNYDNIHSVEIVWEQNADFMETVDTIYIREK